jgi:hypothetical protein
MTTAFLQGSNTKASKQAKAVLTNEINAGYYTLGLFQRKIVTEEAGRLIQISK